MAQAQFISVNGLVVIKSPYNASFVEEIKMIPGRKWNSEIKAWAVPAASEEKAREIARKFFQIEGEESLIEYEVLDLVVCADNTYKRSYPHGVTIDGCDVVYMGSGDLRMQSDAFEILEASGGFTRGDSRHAFEVEYQIKVRVRKGAVIEGYGRCGSGSYKVLSSVAA